MLNSVTNFIIIYNINFNFFRTKRSWFPNVQRKTFESKVLDAKLQLRVTANAIRCIDKAGGFDSYIYHTPSHKLQSKLGDYLKEEMKKTVSEKRVQPPPLIKRLPRPPKHLRTE